jgi:hypothetical protein
VGSKVVLWVLGEEHAWQQQLIGNASKLHWRLCPCIAAAQGLSCIYVLEPLLPRYPTSNPLWKCKLHLCTQPNCISTAVPAEQLKGN